MESYRLRGVINKLRKIVMETIDNLMRSNNEQNHNVLYGNPYFYLFYRMGRGYSGTSLNIDNYHKLKGGRKNMEFENKERRTYEKEDRQQDDLYIPLEKNESRGYKGLEVLEEKNFLGPTSIRYWM